MSDITQQRQAVVAEAREWIRTPYENMGRVKGAGVDCAMLLAEVYERAGVIPHVDVGFYPPDWHLHSNVERLREQVLQYAQPIAGPPAPGDICLFVFGKAYSHSAIVVDWPVTLIHANMTARMVEYISAANDPHLSRCKTEYFSPWGGA